MSELPNFVTRLVEKIAKEEGFTDYRIETAAGSKHGDGFAGVMVSATVIGNRKRNGQSNSDELHLLCKLMPQSVERRKEFIVDVSFEHEVLAYNEVLPLLAKFQRDKGLSDDECFNAYPKCYAAVADAVKDEYVLILEDLRTRGYVMWPKAVAFDNAHAFTVMEGLAKLHAVSFAIKDQRPDEFKIITGIDDVLLEFFKAESARNIFIHSYERAKSVLEDSKHKTIAEELSGNMMGLIADCVGSGTADQYSVLNHGDCWINNMMFRYGDEVNKQLKDVCFIDWQVIRHASPVLDLVYNIFNSTDKEFRQKEYHNLIAHYYRTLSVHIRRLGSDPDTLYPWSVLQQHLLKFGKYAFLICPVQLPMLVADAKDIPNVDEMSAKMANQEGGVGFALKYSDDATEQKYKQRLTDVFTDLVDLGYWN